MDLGITHVLNAAEGKFNNVLTGVEYYRDMDIQYFGVEADDKPTFNISQYFCPAAQFIHEALSHPKSKSRRRAKDSNKTFNWHHSVQKKLAVLSNEPTCHLSFQARCWCTV